MNKFYPIAILAVVISANAFQETNKQTPTPVFSSTTRLVQVNVVALDKSGKPLTDLRKEDFELFEDGRPQTISVFVAEQAKQVVLPVLPPNEFRNQPSVTNVGRSGYALILIDWLNSSKYSPLTSLKPVLKVLQQVDTNDLVALCVLDRGGLRIVHNFTDNRAELVKKLSTAYVSLTEDPPAKREATTTPTRVDETDHTGIDLRPIVEGIASGEVLSTFKTFENIASYLGLVPGRKSIIWVTSGFPTAVGFEQYDREAGSGSVAAWQSAIRSVRRTFSAEMNQMLRRLNNADIAVYAVDAQGLVSDPDVSAANQAGVGRASMNEIAGRTGGRVYYDRNDLDSAIRVALDDSRISYTLGYYSSNTKNDGNYRTLRVKVRRAGVTLRYRNGYEAEGSKKSKVKPEDRTTKGTR